MEKCILNFSFCCRKSLDVLKIYIYIVLWKNIYTTDINCFRLSYICIIVMCSWQDISNIKVRAHVAIK